MALYRRSFTPSPVLDRPYVLIAASVLTAEDDERAEWLAGPMALSFLRLRQGRPGVLPTPEEAAAYEYDPIERAFMADRRRGQILGGPDTVRKAVEDLVASTGADELMVTTMVHGFEDRLRSYELLAEMWSNTTGDRVSNSAPGAR